MTIITKDIVPNREFETDLKLSLELIQGVGIDESIFSERCHVGIWAIGRR